MKYLIRKNSKTIYDLNQGNSYIKKIEEKIKDELNKYCVECGEDNPEYISINNAIFLCKECTKTHLKFPKNISKIRKNNIKSLTLNEIQFLLCGGNRALLNFICNEYPKLAELPSNILYRTQAMIYYRQNLQYLINGCIPPIKPSIKSAYTIPSLFDNENKINFNKENVNKYGMYKNTEIEDLVNNNYKFYKTRYYENNRNIDSQNPFNNDKKMKACDSIGMNEIKFDNYFINRPKEVNFQNNNNIIIGSKMEIINNINKKPILHSFEKKSNKKNKNIREYINNININNINTDVYIRPKLLLSHNGSKTCLIDKSRKKYFNDRQTSFEKINKKYYYSQINNIPTKSKIDSIQLDFSNDLNYNFNKRKLSKNLSHELYKKTKKYIKTSKYMQKSYSQKIFNINNNNNYHYNNIKRENDNHIINQTENNIYIPTTSSTIHCTKKKPNNICISNNEEFQIISRKKTIDITSNKNINIIKNDERNKNSKLEQSANSSPIKINIKVNKKENIENKIIKEKDIKNEKNTKEKEVKKEGIGIKSKNDLKKTENLNNFISKCVKNRILLRKNEKINTFNYTKEKDKEINNGKISYNFKRRICKNSSQEQISKIPNKTIQIQTKINDNKNERKKVSIRNKYKVKNQNK